MPLFGSSGKKSEKQSGRTQRASIPESAQSSGTEERFGLFELWPGTPPGEASKVETVMDIVAVHGLGGHAYETWTEGRRLWLRDFLPESIPDARVFSFGYNSAVAFGGTASKIDDFATSLLERLLQKRRQYKDHIRPIIFVCHSLGGIVFKRALTMAHAQESRYGALKTAIKSVIFMGTPHRGADIANWSRLLRQIARVPGLGDIRTDLLDDLRPKSDLLMTISSDFVERAATLTIFSIYERNFLPGWGDLVVDKDSAVLNLINETRLPVNRDHRTMCKYLTSTSEEYDTVFSCLAEVVDKVKGEDDTWFSKTRADFMKSLVRFDHRDVLSQIPKPLTGTCQWITQDYEFRRWRRTRGPTDHNSSEICPLLYIHGSPGVGKTVMARYVLTYLRQAQKVYHQGPSIVVFFFCDDKDPERRTSFNLLRSLLFQILTSDRSLLRHISEDAMKAHLQKLEDHTMSADEQQDLWDTLSAVIQRSRATQFWIVVDALDELESGCRKNVTRQLSSILAKDSVAKLRVLFTDRQKPRIDFLNLAVIELGSSVSLTDVRSYIRQKVAELCGEVPMENKYRNAIEDEIAMMANGTFLHAALAFANFTRGVTDWTPRVIKSRLNDLQKLPASLEAYYVGLLRLIPADFRRKARRAFMWVLRSSSSIQLTLRELHHAVSINDSQQSWSDLQEDLGYNFEFSFQEACGYLLKVNEQGLVAFAHQTVKELFQSQSNSIREIDEEVLSFYRFSISDIDLEIVQTCVTLLQFKDFGKAQVAQTLIPERTMHHNGSRQDKTSVVEYTSRYPLLLYAIRYWNHFDDVTNELRVSKALQCFLKSFQGNYFRLAAGPWTQESRRMTIYGSSPLPSQLPPLHSCMQSGDFPHTVRGLIASGADVNQTDEYGFTPLHWACARRNKQAMAVLLSLPHINVNKGIPGEDRPIHTEIEWLFWDLRTDASVGIMPMILKDSRCDINATGASSATPLHKCLSLGKRYTAISNFLVDHEEIDLNAEDSDGNTTFSKAFNYPHHEEIVLKMLKNPSLRIDFTMKKYRAGPLNMAGLWGWDAVEEVLIDRDIDEVFSFGDDGFNILTRFAYMGRKAKVLRLLELLKDEGLRLRESVGEGSNPVVRRRSFHSLSRMLSQESGMPPGSDPNNEYRVFHHLLHLCAQQDWQDIVIILEDKFGIRGVMNGDHVGRTMLHWAVENSWDGEDPEKGVKVGYALRDFSDKLKSWLNHQDRDGMTALHIACAQQNHRIAKHLVNSGADYLIKDKLGKNPVHLAAENGPRSIIRLFTDKPTREYGRDKDGRTLLHYLVMWQTQPVIEEFITAKRPIINVKDKNRRTPLWYAALCNNKDATAVLLRHGARANAL